MRTVFLTLALFSTAASAHAAFIRSAGDGNWSMGDTWEGGQIPHTGDIVLIRGGHRVTYDASSDEVIRAVHVSGVLSFAKDRDTLLCTGLIRIAAGEECKEEGFECHIAGPDYPPATGEGPALEIGTMNSPVPAEHRATVRLTYIQGMDPDVFPAILDCGGRMDLHGAPLAHPWVKLDVTAPKEYREIELADKVKDWRPGDQVVFTSTTFSDFYQERDGRRAIPDLLDDSQTEQAEILGASPLGMRLKTPLKYEHRVEGRFKGEVANLSRNVVIESADPAGVRGHTAYHRGSSGSISFAEFRHLGKQGALGRYPIHFHLCGDSMRGSSVIGASVWDSGNRWITLHGSNAILVKDCVGFRSIGHGYFFEDGTEVNNVLDHNLAIQALMGKPLPQQMLPFDRNDGAGFWWANCANSFTRNVAADCGKFGYRFQMVEAPDFSPVLPVLGTDGERHKVDVRTLPFVNFEGNEAHSQRRFALNLGGFHGQSETADLDRDGSVIDRGAYLGGDVGGVGPDYRHPFEIRDFLVWSSHWGFNTTAPNVRIQGFTAHNVNYVFWRSNAAGHDYNGLDCTDIHVSTFFNSWGAGGDRESQLRYVDPLDDAPPVTLITGWKWLDDRRVQIRGVAVDNREVAEVQVNGEVATLEKAPCTSWSHVLAADASGSLEVTAWSTDPAGNREINRQHIRIVRGRDDSSYRINLPPQIVKEPAKAGYAMDPAMQAKAPAPEIREARVAAESLPWPLWDGKESIAKYAERSGLPARKTITLSGGVVLEMELVPAGSFLMGSRETGEPDEKPLHRTILSQPYYMGRSEVTQEQYQAVTGIDPSYFKDPKRPVEQVSWLDAKRFAEKVGQGLRLPTEAEWEFACRAGTETAYFSGDSQGALSSDGWWGHSDTTPDGNAPNGTSEVALKPANAFGLHDMEGNVYEWCADAYSPGYYRDSPVLNPSGPASGDERVIRSGSWESDASKCRSANRNGFHQESRGYLLGFRVVATATAK